MSKRINLVNLAKKVEKKKDKEGSKAATSSTKSVVIREKWPWEEAFDSSLVKKGKANDSKGKEAMPPPEAKKKSNKGRAKGPPVQLLPERAPRQHQAIHWGPKLL